jgi:hypothetical protein
LNRAEQGVAISALCKIGNIEKLYKLRTVRKMSLDHTRKEPKIFYKFVTASDFAPEKNPSKRGSPPPWVLRALTTAHGDSTSSPLVL